MERTDSPKDAEFIRNALSEFNAKRAAPENHEGLTLVERDGEGRIIAGLIGGTYWGWLYVDILWVDEGHRRGGLGSKLLAEAERIGRERGCDNAHLDTMSFQALGFYRKKKYRRIATVRDIPKGHKKYIMIKRLA